MNVFFSNVSPLYHPHPISHHQYPSVSSALPSPFFPRTDLFPSPLVPSLSPRSLPKPSPTSSSGIEPFSSSTFWRSGSGGYDERSGKWVSIDSSSGANVGRSGERMCCIDQLAVAPYAGVAHKCASWVKLVLGTGRRSKDPRSYLP